MKYKVGDIVCIKSISDIGRIIDPKGCVGGLPFKVAMNNYCSSRMTIDQIDDINGYYRMKEDPWHFYNDEMIERLVEDLLDNEMQEHQRICDEIMAIQGIEPIEAEIEEVWHCPDGYIFKDENGNIINATKIVLEKKKKEYPKTFEECCKILGLLNVDLCFNADYRSFDASKEQWKRLGLMNQFYQLLICRDAYWKLYGEEMGLGKPWEPDFDNLSTNLEYMKINKGCFTYSSRVFAFPTEEMRDAFYDNFRELIEQCKELL